LFEIRIGGVIMPRKIDKETRIFLIGLALVSCLGALIGVSKDGQGVESIGLFFKNFVIIFFGLAVLVIALAITMIVFSLWVVLNR